MLPVCAITGHHSLASSSARTAPEASTALGSFSFSRSITAQAIRAVLFASATATTSGGRRRRSPITHGSALVAFDRSRFARPIDEQPAQITVAALGDAAQPGFPAGRILPRHQAQPGRKLTARAEYTGVGYRRRNRRGDDRPNARNARQPLTDRVRLVPSHQLLLQRCNRRFDVLELS